MPNLIPYNKVVPEASSQSLLFYFRSSPFVSILYQSQKVLSINTWGVRLVCYEPESSYEFRNQVVTFRSYLSTYEIFRSVKIAMKPGAAK